MGIYDYDPTKDTCDYAYEPENIHRKIMASMNESWSSTTDEAIKRMAECLRLVIGGENAIRYNYHIGC